MHPNKTIRNIKPYQFNFQFNIKHKKENREKEKRERKVYTEISWQSERNLPFPWDFEQCPLSVTCTWSTIQQILGRWNQTESHTSYEIATGLSNSKDQVCFVYGGVNIPSHWMVFQLSQFRARAQICLIQCRMKLSPGWNWAATLLPLLSLLLSSFLLRKSYLWITFKNRPISYLI